MPAGDWAEAETTAATRTRTTETDTTAEGFITSPPVGQRDRFRGSEDRTGGTSFLLRRRTSNASEYPAEKNGVKGGPGGLRSRPAGPSTPRPATSTGRRA